MKILIKNEKKRGGIKKMKKNEKKKKMRSGQPALNPTNNLNLMPVQCQLKPTSLFVYLNIEFHLR